MSPSSARIDHESDALPYELDIEESQVEDDYYFEAGKKPTELRRAMNMPLAKEVSFEARGSRYHNHQTEHEKAEVLTLEPTILNKQEEENTSDLSLQGKEKLLL